MPERFRGEFLTIGRYTNFSVPLPSTFSNGFLFFFDIVLWNRGLIDPPVSYTHLTLPTIYSV